jgi:hypothetical protein
VRRLRISQPGRAVPPIEFEGPEVELMLRSGCIGVLLDESRTCRLDGQQVARIVAAVAAARLLLRQLRVD